MKDLWIHLGSSLSGFGQDLVQDKFQRRVCGPLVLVYNGNTSKKNKPVAAESGLLMLTHQALATSFWTLIKRLHF